MERVEVLIAGAGVTGLALADALEGKDYLVCEALDEVGGYCRTVQRDGFVWDYSGHFFHFRDPELERLLVSRMGDQRVLKVNKSAKIWWDGQLIDFPFQKNIHQLPREDFLDCLVDLYFRDEAEAKSFQQMLYAKFGRSIAEKFLIPYNEKLYATDLDRLDVHAMGRFFPHADIDEVIRNFRQPDAQSYNSTFTYAEGGAIQYVMALMHGVDPSRVRLREPIQSVDLERKVAHTPTGPIQYDRLVSSVPFVRLLEMCGMPCDSRVYTWNKVLVFNLGFDRKGWPGVHWVYFPQRQLSFYRVGFYDNIFDSPRMSLYVELGFPQDVQLTEEAIERHRVRVLEDLRKCGVVDDQELVAWHSVVLDPAYVHITERSIADVAAKKRQLAEHGVHSIGRYGSWTYCSIEDNMIEARALAQAIQAKSSPAASE